MAQYIPFEDNVEVIGQTVLTTVEAFPEFMKNVGLSILEKHGIKQPVKDKWYPQKAWLESFKEIEQKYGQNTLFEIGKKIPEKAIFPPQIQDLKQALTAIDMAYQMNHRNGKIGYYKLVSFDEVKKRAVMECNNPYPCNFDKGVITTMARRFNKSNGAINVELDSTKQSRQNGAEKSWYIISWN